MQAFASAFSGSNRTFMELKFQNLDPKLQPLKCSNRTFMELKYGQIKNSIFKLIVVLIVPLWN